MRMQKSFEESLAEIPEGQYAVGVSGGADSVALLRLVMQLRPDVGVHVVHLNHETRGKESEGDAEFVEQLARKFSLPHTMLTRREMKPLMDNPPTNKSALFRAMRIELFSRIVENYGLDGVLLAHHRDDQAETVLHRLLRGSGARGLAGMSFESRQGSLSMFRPLLSHGREELREYLRSIGETWREDSSNQSGKYLRNRLRAILSVRPGVAEGLVGMAERMGDLRSWARANAPKLVERFAMVELAGWPRVLALESARAWLLARGASPSLLSGDVLERFVQFATDAASARRQVFPGVLRVVRRRGWIEAENYR